MKHSPPSPHLVMLLALSGCHLFSSGAIDETCEDLTDGCGAVALKVESITPPYATSGLESTATIKGAGFTEGVQVEVGGELAEILSQTDGALEVQVPDSLAGVADVKVSHPDGSTDMIEEGIEYFPDADGAVQFFAFLEAAEAYTEEEFVDRQPRGRGSWVEDTDLESWAVFAPGGLDFTDSTEEGGCTAKALGYPLTPLPEDFAAMELSDGSTSLALEPGEDGRLDLADVDPDSFPWDASLDLQSYAYSARVSLEMAGIVKTPARLQLMADDWSSSRSGNLINGNHAITTIPESNEAQAHKLIVLGFGYRDYGSGIPDATISCVAKEDGYFRLDESAWEFTNADWVDLNVIELFIGRMRTTDSVLPHTNGIVRFSATHWLQVLGTPGDFR